jgi:2-keto-4-pentenoate hydratase/2-oxohepta-3-ene-1,7-dioic acid hydratase in catechol pathway
MGASVPDLRSAIAQDAFGKVERLTGSAEADFFVNELVFLPVIPNPGKIICVGLNYEAHRVESKRDVTTDPTLFLRIPESQTGHERPLLCPSESLEFDFEGEIAVVIGRGGRRISESNALAHVAGLSCYNDGSARDWQQRATQWTAGKNFPATGAFGPWLVTPDELPLDRELSLVTRLNDVEVQRATTDMMIFPIQRLVSFISTFMTLEPGDVIVTGTPGGVGFRRTPPLFMKPGDRVEVEVSGVGVLRNTVTAESNQTHA